MGKSRENKESLPKGRGDAGAGSFCHQPLCPMFEDGIRGISLPLQVGKDESSLRNVRKSKNNPILCPQKIHKGAVGGWKRFGEKSRRSVAPYFCSFLPNPSLTVTQSWGPHGDTQTLDTRAWCQEVARCQQCHRAGNFHTSHHLSKKSNKHPENGIFLTVGAMNEFVRGKTELEAASSHGGDQRKACLDQPHWSRYTGALHPYVNTATRIPAQLQPREQWEVIS